MDKLKTLREDRNLTVADLAAKAKVTPRYLYYLESGGRDNPQLTTLLRIARALDVPLVSIIE